MDPALMDLVSQALFAAGGGGLLGGAMRLLLERQRQVHERRLQKQQQQQEHERERERQEQGHQRQLAQQKQEHERLLEKQRQRTAEILIRSDAVADFGAEGSLSTTQAGQPAREPARGEIYQQGQVLSLPSTTAGPTTSD